MTSTLATRATLAICSLLVPLVVHASPCKARITKSDAIHIAKRQIAREFDPKAVTYFGPYTAELRDCTWTIRGATPPRDVSGDVFVYVNARTGRAQVEPRLRTDPRKFDKVYGKRR
ncbi:MAG: hypothetical protein WAO00_14010 [Chthoniobacterales bacterium]